MEKDGHFLILVDQVPFRRVLHHFASDKVFLVNHELGPFQLFQAFQVENPQVVFRIIGKVVRGVRHEFQFRVELPIILLFEVIILFIIEHRTLIVLLDNVEVVQLLGTLHFRNLIQVLAYGKSPLEGVGADDPYFFVFCRRKQKLSII